MSEDPNHHPDQSARKYLSLQTGDYEHVVEKRPRSRLRRVLKLTTRAVLLGAVVTAVCAAPAVVDRYREARESSH